jgi:sulfur-carrier protein
MITKIRVFLPFHLRNLARVYDDVELEISPARNQAVTLGTLLDAIELRYPVLRGTIRDPDTLRRRPFVRFYACKEDLSHEPPETPLPPEIVAGAEAFMIIGAMAGG